MTITGLILAGGRGARMGMVDKGLQMFRGAPMAAHVMQRLAPQVSAVAINANQNLDAYRTFDVPVWTDAMPDFAGPLAGLQTGLMHCATPYMTMAPCDSPFLPLDLVERLKHALDVDNADLAVAVAGAGDERQVHSVFCLLKTSLLPNLTSFLQNGGRKMQLWFDSVRTVEADFPDEVAFRNINTLEELKEFER